VTLVPDQKMIIPDDVKKELREYCENHNIEIGSLKEQFREIYYGPCKSFPEEDGTRARQTKNALKAILNASSGFGENIDGIVLVIGHASSITTKKGTKDEKVSQQVRGLGIFTDGEKKRLATITAWDEAIMSAKKIPKDKLIRLNGVSVNDDENYGFQVTYNRTSSFIVLKDDEINSSEMIQKFFKSMIIDVDEADMKPSKGRNDKRIIKGRVKDCRISASKKGNILAWYKIISDNVSDSELKDNPKEHVFDVRTDPLCGKFMAGSLCYFIGTISPTTQEYSASMFAEAVIPITQFEKKKEDLDAEIANAEAQAEYNKNNPQSKPQNSGSPQVNDSDIEEITEDIDIGVW